MTRRSTLAFPYMAYLGKMTISAIPDIAGLSFYRSLTPRKLRSVTRALNLLKEVPRRGLEGLDVALSDTMRSLRATGLADVADLIDSRQFGHTAKGRALGRVDTAISYMQNKFGSATGMNRWNTNMKRTAAHLVMQELIVGARKMGKVGSFIKQGDSYASAVKRVGLSSQDAIRLNHLGLNADRSKCLLDTLYKHGLDADGGKPWGTNRAAFDAHDGAIFPELSKWYQSDRDLFETWTGAVNSEVQNIIVEPKLMSRPLMNATWLGRMFNQFQSFAFSWGNEFAQMAAQRPSSEQAQYIGQVLALGAVSDAIHNALAGRRTFAETSELWTERHRSECSMPQSTGPGSPAGLPARSAGPKRRRGDRPRISASPRPHSRAHRYRDCPAYSARSPTTPIDCSGQPSGPYSMGLWTPKPYTHSGY